jgi:hypothetical protein
VRANVVVVAPPLFDADLGVEAIANHCRLKYSLRNLPLNDSSVPFCHGFPGSMNAVSMCAVWSHLRMAVATNSGPLSERKYCGAPWTLTSCASTSITRPDRKPPATSIAPYTVTASFTAFGSSPYVGAGEMAETRAGALASGPGDWVIFP